MDDSGPITDPAQLGCPAPPTGTTWPGAMQAIVGGQNTLPQASQTEQGRYSSAMLLHCFRTGFCLNLLMKNLSRFVVTHPQEADELTWLWHRALCKKQHEKGTGSPGSSSSLLLNPAECLSHLALVSSKKQVDLTLFWLWGGESTELENNQQPLTRGTNCK